MSKFEHNPPVTAYAQAGGVTVHMGGEERTTYDGTNYTLLPVIHAAWLTSEQACALGWQLVRMTDDHYRELRKEEEPTQWPIRMSAEPKGVHPTQPPRTPNTDNMGWSTNGIIQHKAFARYCARWNAKEDADLLRNFWRGSSLRALAALHRRNTSGVYSRLDRLLGAETLGDVLAARGEPDSPD
jgi:hypothetical protein